MIKQNIAHDGIREVRLLTKVVILLVLDERLLVTGVALVLAEGIDKLLVKEELARVGGDVVPDGAVGEALGARDVGHDVDVRGAAGVVTGEVGAEPDGAVGVGLA